MGRTAVDITNRRFGLLTAKHRTEKKSSGTFVWECECECGNLCYVSLANLQSENVKSCGCLAHTHQQTNTRLYKVWNNMKSRCYIPNATEYENYGGRGIQVCREWKTSFESFRDWAMENGYNDSLTIDRIDTGKDYEPSNCKWSTYEEQLNNTSRNRVITYNGKTMTMAQWAKELGMNYNTLNSRINIQKLTIQEAFERPVKSRYS